MEPSIIGQHFPGLFRVVEISFHDMWGPASIFPRPRPSGPPHRGAVRLQCRRDAAGPIERDHRTRFGKTITLEHVDTGSGEGIGEFCIQSRSTSNNILHSTAERSAPFAEYQGIGEFELNPISTTWLFAQSEIRRQFRATSWPVSFSNPKSWLSFRGSSRKFFPAREER